MKNSKSKTKFYEIQTKQLNIERLQIIINNGSEKKQKQEKERRKNIPVLINMFLKWINRHL